MFDNQLIRRSVFVLYIELRSYANIICTQTNAKSVSVAQVVC